MRGRPRRVYRGKALREPTAPTINPNDPRSPRYAERHRQTVTDWGNGMRVVSMGEAVQAPGRTSIPVEVVKPEPEEAPEIPEETPSVPEGFTPVPSRSWRKDYGLSKGG